MQIWYFRLILRCPPPKPIVFFFTNVSYLLDARKDAIKKASSYMFLFAKKGLSNDGVGVARGTIFAGVTAGS